jgi:uncharacterized protein (DUF433 family)
MDWSGCETIEMVPGKVSGAPVFKDSRLPVSAIFENVEAFMELDGLSQEEAIVETLLCYPETPGGAEGIRALLTYRAAHERELQAR